MFMQNQWYVAAWDHEIDRTPVARTICGETIMMYRRFDRSVVAMRDACPHRLLPLSMGYKEGDNIRCRYHGLLLDSHGSCVEMPLKNEPPNRRVQARMYPVVERYRYIWVWIGDPAKTDPAVMPDFWPCEHPDWTFDGGYYHVKCDYRLMIDNLMDLSHETYTHVGSIGQLEIMESPMQTQTRGEQVTVSRWMPGVDAPPFWRNALRKDGLVNRWQICLFQPPTSVTIDVGVSPVELGDTVDSHDRGVRGMVIDGITPETATTTHYFWGMARNFDIQDVGFTKRLKTQQGNVFAEDSAVLEAQQRSVDANPDMKLKAFSVDSGGVRARLIIERLLREQQNKVP
jgi:phenylpropionate dioxygenase-like ring-hydroxylating dioxygenase large terminal subunit